MREAAEQGNAEQLRHAAHTLKGSGGNMGARAVQKLSQMLEQIGRNGTVEGASEIVLKLEHEYERARQKV